MIYTVKGFGVVNKAEVDVFLELSLFIWSNTLQFDLSAYKARILDILITLKYFLKCHLLSEAFPDQPS